MLASCGSKLFLKSGNHSFLAWVFRYGLSYLWTLQFPVSTVSFLIVGWTITRRMHVFQGFLPIKTKLNKNKPSLDPSSLSSYHSISTACLYVSHLLTFNPTPSIQRNCPCQNDHDLHSAPRFNGVLIVGFASKLVLDISSYLRMFLLHSSGLSSKVIPSENFLVTTLSPLFKCFLAVTIS